MRGFFLAASAFLAAAPAAADKPSRPNAARPAEASVVSELVVSPEAKCLPPRTNPTAPAPRIVGTFPTDGAMVRPGRLVLRVTFDRPMSCRGFFVARPPIKSPCAANRQKLVLSFDRRTVRLLCATIPNTTYSVRIGDEMLQAFVSLDGHRAQSQDLTFTTSAGPRVETVREALGEDR